jgi:hypothetical protein
MIRTADCGVFKRRFIGFDWFHVDFFRSSRGGNNSPGIVAGRVVHPGSVWLSWI